MNGLAVKNLAHAIAVHAHDGQCRRGLGEPYLEHVEAVADSVYGWETKAIAYLHDTLEDTFVTSETLSALLIPGEIIACVVLLTHHDHLSYEEYIDRMIADGNPKVIFVKIADLKHNLRDIDSANMPKKKIKYLAALERLEEWVSVNVRR